MIGPTLSLTHCVDPAIGTFGTIVVVGTVVCVGTALFSLLFLAEGLHTLAIVSQWLESQAHQSFLSWPYQTI